MCIVAQLSKGETAPYEAILWQFYNRICHAVRLMSHEALGNCQQKGWDTGTNPSLSALET